MKIRYDFVTNSSSTSFIIISDGEFNLKKFIDAVGIEKESPFIDLYKDLFESFKYSMSPAREYYEQCNSSREYSTFEDFVKSWFWYGKELLPKILDAESQGKQVFLGGLRSDNGEIEGFFCTDEFIIEADGLHIDARENGW
ncbi:MAG: hypothetical protein KDC84_15375 [Crocinitomicaceae bacterium]|nr:hypothetical protein [Crocinitomicaceae bacterium]